MTTTLDDLSWGQDAIARNPILAAMTHQLVTRDAIA
jgi:hypothetical protein